MEKWSQWIYDYLGMSHSIQYKIVATIVVAVVFYTVQRIVRHFVLRKIKSVKIRYTWKKSIQYLTYVLFFIVITPIWIAEMHSVGTFLGLLTAGLAFALKEPISNLFAWVYLITKKPFEMGDRIQIGDSEGDVLDIGFFEFTMMEIKNWVQADQSTGRIIHVPNGLIFTRPTHNYNQAMNYIWNEIPILITFESNWKKAKEIFLDIENNHLKQLVVKVDAQLERAFKDYHLYYSNVNPTVYTSIRPNGILLTLRYLCNPKSRRSSEQIAIELILEAFAQQDDIEFAYPTTRFYNAVKEDKKMHE